MSFIFSSMVIYNKIWCLGRVEVFTAAVGPEQKLLRTVDAGMIFGKKDVKNER